MTASTIELAVSADDRRIAGYAVAAITLSLAETALPSPVPGIKPGLANIVILVVLLRHGWHDAAWVAVLRVLGGGLLSGQFLTPGFFLGLTGTLFSLGMLAVAVRLPRRAFGPLSHSLIAAFAHIGGQFALARLWLIPHDGLYALLPLFATAALLFGSVNGLVAAWWLQRGDEAAALPAPTSRSETP